ncbi:MAG: DUF2285 domain-containing protein [Hyphomicrobium sp.]|jgi:hypothetical protein
MPDGARRFASITQGLFYADYAVAAVKLRLGVFAPFADPNEPAPTANVFWSPDALPLTLSGTATRMQNCDLCLARLQSVRQLMIDARGLQLLRFKSDRQTLSLILDGVAVAVAPARVVFHVEGLENLECARDGFATLSEILRHNTDRSEDRHWTATSLAMRDALIALDGHRARATYRDIATVIFGAERTKEAWRSASTALKDRIRRSLKRGLELVAGDYRELL